jgi:hypothetical protein
LGKRRIDRAMFAAAPVAVFSRELFDFSSVFLGWFTMARVMMPVFMPMPPPFFSEVEEPNQRANCHQREDADHDEKIHPSRWHAFYI